MSLAESQQFFYDLCAHPETIREMRKDRKALLAKYFASDGDRQELARYPLERFQTYRNHISIGLLGGIETAFPVLRSRVSKVEWNELLNDFYLKRLTRSPIARRVFTEFSAYLQEYQGPLLKKLPYLHDLAEYENLDLWLHFAEDDLNEHKWATEEPDDPLTLIPVLNPLVELRVYSWPVHKMTKRSRAPRGIKPGQYPIIVYRHPTTLRIG